MPGQIDLVRYWCSSAPKCRSSQRNIANRKPRRPWVREREWAHTRPKARPVLRWPLVGQRTHQTAKMPSSVTVRKLAAAIAWDQDAVFFGSSDQSGRCAAVDRELRGCLAKDEAIAANTLRYGNCRRGLAQTS